MIRCLAAVFLAGALVAPAATAGPAFLPGEVLVGGRPAYPIEGGLAYIQAYSAAGIYQRDAAQFWGLNPRDALMLGSDVLFVDVPGVVTLHPDGTLSLYAASDYGFGSIAIDAHGNVLVGYQGSNSSGGPVLELDSRGNQIAAFSLPGDRAGLGVVAMDLAADQCTLYYATAGQHVKRYDICHGSALPDLVDLGPGVFVLKIRVLADGSVLAAGTNGIVRLSSSGVPLQVYGKGELWESLSVDDAGTSFWAGCACLAGVRIEKFDLNSGAVLAGPVPTLLPPPFPPSLAVPPEFVLVVGERRAAQTALTDPAQIPALSARLEIVLILLIAVVALVRLR